MKVLRPSLSLYFAKLSLRVFVSGILLELSVPPLRRTFLSTLLRPSRLRSCQFIRPVPAASHSVLSPKLPPDSRLTLRRTLCGLRPVHLSAIIFLFPSWPDCLWAWRRQLLLRSCWNSACGFLSRRPLPVWQARSARRTLQSVQILLPALFLNTLPLVALFLS